MITPQELAAGPLVAAMREAVPAPAGDAALCYISGTTGPPKGVRVSHRMLRLAGEGVMLVADARDGDVMFLREPLYRIGGAQMVVALLDAEGRPVPQGERGEIVVSARDPLVLTQGCLDNPEATARALRDGRLHTRDWGSFDTEENLFFHGRMSDSARVRGENVGAWEVEAVAARHPAIADCAMIGVAADLGEQEIKLFVELRPGVALREAELCASLTPHLERCQLPRFIAIVPGFERTPSRRIMKHRLSPRRDDCWDRLAA